MDDGIDDETVDLFAAMNSAVLELQIEMDLLESKEYQNDNGNEVNRIKDNANDQTTIQESLSSSPPPSYNNHHRHHYHHHHPHYHHEKSSSPSSLSS